jgi:hypothetical protein
MLPADCDLRLCSVFNHLSDVFEVLADAGLLDTEALAGSKPNLVEAALAYSLREFCDGGGQLVPRGNH